MPPASNSHSASSKAKGNNRNISPDVDTTVPEQETQPRPSKKKNKNAAAKQAHISSLTAQTVDADADVIREEELSPNARRNTILSQIPHAFSTSRRRDNLLEVDDEVVSTTEIVSDQYTPPNDNWLDHAVYEKSVPIRPAARISPSPSPPVEPGFSTRARYESKSPPVSPPTRYVRPVSHGIGIPPVPTHPKASTSPYAFSPHAYASPPAPHMPQQHFYHAQDVNLNLPLTNNLQPPEESSLIRSTWLSPGYGGSRQGIILGFEGRLSVLRLENGTVEEIGALGCLPGTVVDAVLLEWDADSTKSGSSEPLVAIIIHGPKETPGQENDKNDLGDGRLPDNPPAGLQNNEYSTRVEVYSLSTQTCLAVLLETASQTAQPAFRGVPPTPPNPIGQLKLQASGMFLIAASGASGEVFVFTMRTDPQPAFECVTKLWSMIQPQLQRRDSSHLPASDADISPADLGRATGATERAIASVNGRWLAVCPAGSSSRPSLGATLGATVVFGRHANLETASAPTRPPVTCEVDSPDADTLFGKVARGVAQELVKGARWLGDQGMQTWQNYWKKEQSPSGITTQPTYSPPVHPISYAPNTFPPTHGEMSNKSKEPDLVAIYDLQAICELANRRQVDEVRPLATFQPPRGCSFVSFSPHGLSLLTAGRKGDVQYVWDLMQVKTCRTLVNPVDDDKARMIPRVRQIAKFERLSGSTIVDAVWDVPNGARFAVLTRNKTIHLFDLPSHAFRWPPPRTATRARPVSRSIDTVQHETPATGGFFASAMNIANQAQPMLANWRGRAPSIGGGLAGIGQTGIGFASATGVKGSKAVAAGLSKSLGAASETVSQIRHAGENRMHLKSSKAPLPGKIVWIQTGRKSILSVFEGDCIKQYQVRRNKVQDKRDRDSVTVFEARKATIITLPRTSRFDHEPQTGQALNKKGEATDQRTATGFWRPKPLGTGPPRPLSHPLSSAEIETNAPYQPFHSDRRVNLRIYSETGQTGNQLPTASVIVAPQPKSRKSNNVSKWVFGDDIPSIKLNVNRIQVSEDENSGSVIYRETMKVSTTAGGNDDVEQIVSTTRRRKVKRGQHAPDEAGSDVEREDGFFEDDCDVLDFATDRV